MARGLDWLGGLKLGKLRQPSWTSLFFFEARIVASFLADLLEKWPVEDGPWPICPGRAEVWPVAPNALDEFTFLRSPNNSSFCCYRPSRPIADRELKQKKRPPTTLLSLNCGLWTVQNPHSVRTECPRSTVREPLFQLTLQPVCFQVPCPRATVHQSIFPTDP